MVTLRVRVRHRIDKMARDYAEIPAKAQPQMRRIVEDNVKHGRDLARALAREKAGPHGKDYYKRINADMNVGLGLFGNTYSGEFGPDGIPKSQFVGVGFRSGHNTDLEQAGDQVLMSTSRDVRAMLTRLFK